MRKLLINLFCVVSLVGCTTSQLDDTPEEFVSVQVLATMGGNTVRYILDYKHAVCFVVFSNGGILQGSEDLCQQLLVEAAQQ